MITCRIRDRVCHSADSLNHDFPLSKTAAFPILGLVILSSLSYVPDQILGALSHSAGLSGVIIGLIIAAFLVPITLSNQQIINSFPQEPSPYQVTQHNLGSQFALVSAAASLLAHTSLVAITISVAVKYLVVGVPILSGQELWVVLGIMTLLVLFYLWSPGELMIATPGGSYLFLGILTLLILVGGIKCGFGLLPSPTSWSAATQDTKTLSVWQALGQAFSAGCVLLAASNQILTPRPRLRGPKAKNRGLILGTSSLMGAVYLICLLALSLLCLGEAGSGEVSGGEGEQNPAPVLIQLAGVILSRNQVLIFILAMLIAFTLVLVGKQAFGNVLHLISLLSRDSFLPRQVHKRADRLFYSLVIIGLGVLIAAAIFCAQVEITSMLPIYLISTFGAMTISQLGMWHHWSEKLRTCSLAKNRRAIRRKQLINLVGAGVTAAIMVSLVGINLRLGSAFTLALITGVYVVMFLIGWHYRSLATDLEVEDWAQARTLPSRVHGLVLVSELDQSAMRAIAYAKATTPSNLSLVTVQITANNLERTYQQWKKSGLDVPLTVLASPFQDLTGPIMQHIRSIRRRSPRDLVTVYIPYLLVKHFWQSPLHNHSATRLRRKLQYLPGVITVMVPWNLDNQVAKTSPLGSKPIGPPELYRQKGPNLTGGSQSLLGGAFVGKDRPLAAGRLYPNVPGTAASLRSEVKGGNKPQKPGSAGLS